MARPRKPKQPPAIWVRTDQLVPWIDNPMVHSEDQIARLCASITETAKDAARERGQDPDADPSCIDLTEGWGNPLQIRLANKEIIAGHCRVLAAQRLEIAWIPCRPLGISEKQAHRLARADNRIAELAEWDEEKLLRQLEADMLSDEELAHILDDAERDAAAIEPIWAQGFDQDYLDALLEEHGGDGAGGGEGGDELEDPPVGDPPKDPVTKLGDVWELGRHVLVCGSVMDGLPFADGEAQTCVTSPPYWGLRDYGEEGQLGLEKTPEEHCERMVQVYREVRRVLRPDGTCWMNYGDCYAQKGGKQEAEPLEVLQERAKRKGYDVGAWGAKGKDGQGIAGRAANTAVSGLKPKDLVGMPWMVAFALRADGWWLRSDIIWSKPNPMPESTTDRCTKAHEYVFLLAAAARYFYDADAIREPSQTGSNAVNRAARVAASGGALTGGTSDVQTFSDKRNKRSVWTVAPKPYAEAHFATFPPALIEPCIKAGTSERGCCSKCGAPWERVVGNASGGTIGKAWLDHDRDAECGNLKTGSSKGYRRGKTKGWEPTCKCSADLDPCTVLDPFMGAGTTIVVAEQLDRRAIGTELSPAYCDIIVERWQTLTGGKAKRRKRRAA
jgi:DNA modification methylase